MERPSTTESDSDQIDGDQIERDEIDWDDPQSLRFPRPHDPDWPPDWPKTIPLDFIYDPETDAYYAPGNEPGAPSTVDFDALTQRIEDTIAEIRSRPRIPKGQQKKIPPGLLGKSKEPRKTKAAKPDSRQRTLFSEDDDPRPEEPRPAASDPADEDRADGGS